MEDDGFRSVTRTLYRANTRGHRRGHLFNIDVVRFFRVFINALAFLIVLANAILQGSCACGLMCGAGGRGRGLVCGTGGRGRGLVWVRIDGSAYVGVRGW